MTKKTICLFLVFLLLFSSMFSPMSFSATKEELMKEKERLSKEIEQKKKDLANIKDEVKRQQALLAQQEDLLDSIKALIEINEALIVEIKLHLTETQEKLDAKERELKEYYRMLGVRIRYLHMNNSTSALSLILGADSYSDALIIGQYMTEISEYDTNLIDKTTATRNEIAGMVDSINRDLSDQEDLLEENTAARELQIEIIQQTRTDLNYAQAEQYVIQKSIEEKLKEIEEMNAEIARLMSVWSDIPYFGEGFRWPVPGFDHISSGYGWRTLYGVQNFHAGIDIAGSGIYGAGVVASGNAFVSTVVYSSVGYGNYIILDHGGGFMTLYGHLSSILVVKGEEVKQGTVIGGVGSTGNSTGPHLHFEIRLQGEKLNPLTEGNLLRY